MIQQFDNFSKLDHFKDLAGVAVQSLSDLPLQKKLGHLPIIIFNMTFSSQAIGLSFEEASNFRTR